MQTIGLQVVVPFHQSLKTSEQALHQAYEQTYAPLLTALEQQAHIRLALHFNGHLLEYLSRHHEDFLLRLKKLIELDRIEILGGLFYGGIPALLPELDIRGQIEMLREFWESFVGVSPSGFWLPQLTWTKELPRLFYEVGLHYGFVGQSQLQLESMQEVPSLGVVERAGTRLAAFVLDERLSLGLWQTSQQKHWHQTLKDRMASAHERVHQLWVPAEYLSVPALLSNFDANNVTLFLPHERLAQLKPAPIIYVKESCLLESPEEVHAHSYELAPYDRPMHQRMLRLSNKLRDAIAMMQDEELEEEWSDVLATAQREVFSSQTFDTVVCEAKTLKQMQEAAFTHVIYAEKLIDQLLYKSDAWLRIDEGDFDGDLSEDIFVSNKLLSVWLAFAQGIRIQTLEHRSLLRNVLSVQEGSPFIESFFQKSDKTFWQPTWKLTQKSVDTEHFKLELIAQNDTLFASQTLIIPKNKARLELSYKIQTNQPLHFGLRLPLSVKHEIQQMQANDVFAAWSSELQWETLHNFNLKNTENEEISIHIKPDLQAQWRPLSKTQNSGVLQLFAFVTNTLDAEIAIELAQAMK